MVEETQSTRWKALNLKLLRVTKERHTYGCLEECGAWKS